MTTMQEIIAEAKQRPGYAPPLPAQVEFADRVVLLTQKWSDYSVAKMLALAYAETLAAGNLSNPHMDEWAKMFVLCQINRESAESFLGRKLPW